MAWIPTRPQWIVIWLGAVLGLFFWVDGSSNNEGSTRFGIAILALAALGVWSLSAKGSR